MSADREVLQAAMAPLRSRLEGGSAAATAVDPRSALGLVCAACRLTDFERDVLVLAAGCEIDPHFATVVSRAHGEGAAGLPTVGLALERLQGASWEAFASDRPLRRLALLELGAAPRLIAQTCRIPERLLMALLGVDTVEERLAAYVKPLVGADVLADVHAALAQAASDAWSVATDAWPTLVLAGPDQDAKRAIAKAVAANLGLRPHALDLALLPEGAEARADVAKLWRREALLGGAMLFAVLGDELEPAKQRGVVAWLESVPGAVMVSARDRVRVAGRPTRLFDVDRPPADDQDRLWRRALGGRAELANRQIDRIVGQFSLDAGVISRIGGSAPIDGLWEEARREARPAMDELAERLPGGADWSRIVLPPAQVQGLQTLAGQVRHRRRVYAEWGFGESGRGLGVSALFAGPSGVGKTLAAEILANELGLDAYRIDLSQLVSKYIGETEKNLRRVFDAAEAGGAVLLFDEADAVFGKRTAVHDSHDRYANIEVSYLLQRMESYGGLAILTTNFKSAIDPAFMRRLRFVIDFPFPGPEERARIWRTAIPKRTPVGALDFARLAQLNVAGGHIRNIALAAGFYAAEEGAAAVGMPHLLRGARAEYAKLDHTLSEAEIAGWS